MDQTKPMIRAVLFDLDGVIADTLHFHYLAWQKMFSELGGRISEYSVLVHEGRASREILPLFLEEAGVTLPESEYHDFIERKRAYYRSIVRVSYFPHAFKIVATLRKRGFQTALVTASATENMKTSVNEEQRTLFDFIVTGDEVPRAKPSPDPYLAAAHALGIPVEECLVVENAPLGIESAKRAGMTCVAVETTLPAENLSEADIIINELLVLLDLDLLQHAGSANG